MANGKLYFNKPFKNMTNQHPMAKKIGFVFQKTWGDFQGKTVT